MPREGSGGDGGSLAFRIDRPGAAAKLGGMSWNRSPAASARVRVACGALLILALGTVLSFTAFYKVCTGFRFWDDMGYVMLTQKTLATGHPLYDQTYTQYGPAYYAWKQVLHGVTRLPLSHDSKALFAAASWVVASLLCAGYVARMTRSLFLTALAGFGVFYMLDVLQVRARASAGILRRAAGIDRWTPMNTDLQTQVPACFYCAATLPLLCRSWSLKTSRVECSSSVFIRVHLWL